MAADEALYRRRPKNLVVHYRWDGTAWCTATRHPATWAHRGAGAEALPASFLRTAWQPLANTWSLACYLLVIDVTQKACYLSLVNVTPLSVSAAVLQGRQPIRHRAQQVLRHAACCRHQCRRSNFRCCC
jgi:hypothetical protein